MSKRKPKEAAAKVDKPAEHTPALMSAERDRNFLNLTLTELMSAEQCIRLVLQDTCAQAVFVPRNDLEFVLAEIDRLRAINADLLDELKRIEAWLIRLADGAEQTARNNERFEAFAKACWGDAKNYRATAASIAKVVAKAVTP